MTPTNLLLPEGFPDLRPLADYMARNRVASLTLTIDSETPAANLRTEQVLADPDDVARTLSEGLTGVFILVLSDNEG